MKIRWHNQTTPQALERLYRALLPHLRAVARVSGYALGAHGSMRRDLDLIAVPWTPEAVAPDDLARRLAFAACGVENTLPPWQDKPHGRKAIALPIGMRAYIDLSVVPFVPTTE